MSFIAGLFNYSREFKNTKVKIQNYKLKVKKTFVLILLFTFYFFLFPSQKIYASESFITDYTVDYTVGENGNTKAAMNISLTNKANDYSYAASYKVQLGFQNISNVSASDLGGAISPDVEKTDGGYVIALTFNKKVVGLGNKQQFKINFETNDVAQKQGNIWEINIPGIANQEAFRTFDVNLHVPPSFGQASYIKPAQENNQLHFTKEQLSKSGISIAFGDKQNYAFTLLYHLQNKNLFPIRTEIALPPDTNYQKVAINFISPEPVQVKKDRDGNWLAEYNLFPGKSVNVRVTGTALLSLYPTKETLTAKDELEYLSEKPYWQIMNDKIKKLAIELKTPEAIYNYVVNTLHYDFSRVTSSENRLGALGVLEQPDTAVCLEFTDLFIAIARAAGIPAREVDGFAYTENQRQRPLSFVQDILHAWPEYYDKVKQTWVMIDPTWGNTTGGVDYFHTLDVDHFAFTKKGLSSTYPIPAGGYKTSDSANQKDIYITFESLIQEKENTFKVISDFSPKYIGGLPIEGRVTIVNKGPSVSKPEVFTIKSNILKPLSQEFKIPEMLPYSNAVYTISFDKQPFLTNNTDIITMSLAGKNYTQKVQILPIFTSFWKTGGGIIIGILTFIILIFAIKTWRLPVSRRK